MNPLSTGESSSRSFSLARLSRVRHDLRNPLGEILGFADVLLEEAEEQGLHDLLPNLRTIEHAAAGILGEVNHRLSPGATIADLDSLAALEKFIDRHAELILETARTLSARCDDLENNAFGDDLLRITGSTRRLREIAPTLLAGLREAIDQPEGSEPETKSSATAADWIVSPRMARGTRLGGTVLVVDDEESNRALLARRLRREGYTVALAETGRQALEKLRQRKFDLLLLDILLPEMDGFEVLRQIKSDPATQNVPVIMLSALDATDAVVRCIELGADDYLPKPFPAPLLRARVRSCLANKRLTDQLRRYTEWLFGKSLFAQAVTAPGSLALRPQERSLLFADIRGFTEWSERRGPEEVVEMLNHYFERAEKTLTPSPVIITEYTGDEIMGVFPSALDAARTALELQSQVGAFLAQNGLELGMGIHAGPVIEGLMGGTDVKGYCVGGDTVNTARRVCDHARGGEILVSDAALLSLENKLHLGERFELVVKGKRDPLRLARLLGLSA